MERLTTSINGNVCYRDKICTLEDVLEKLYELENKQEQGLLMELPCKVGDKVYIIIGKDISEQKIVGYKISSIDGYEAYTLRKIIALTDFGETVFLTKEEAEQALERMKAGGV